MQLDKCAQVKSIHYLFIGTNHHSGITYSPFLPSIMQQIYNTDSHLIHKKVVKYIKVIKINKILNIYALSQCYMFRPYKAIFRQHCALIKYRSFSYVVFFISFFELRLFLSLVCYFLDVRIKCPVGYNITIRVFSSF
jgi:hypothetical protein